MGKIYFTLTGTNHYFGKEFLKKGTKIRLEKEPDNEYDKEAIKVTYEMYAVAAAVIGGVSTLGGSGLLVGVIAGAGVWAVLQNGLTFANAPVAIRNIVIGVIVVVCVLMDIVRSNGTFKIKK